MSKQPAGPTYDNRLEVVVVSLNYGDFLAQTLPMNLAHVDRLVVVTGHEDAVTRDVCHKWSVECILTDIFTEKGDTFNKGAAINFGLGALRQKGWMLQLDADVVLPVTCRNMLDKSALQRDCLYGAERCNVVGWEQWHALKRRWHDDPQFGYHYIMSTSADYPVGANVVHKQWGYTPVGYFQLWHSEYMRKYGLRYPETEGSAENMDVQWAARWPRKSRLLLPTLRVFHLESEAVQMGTNWQGRKTKPFTADGEPIKPAPCAGYGYGAA